jgi:hypothetical protein
MYHHLRVAEADLEVQKSKEKDEGEKERIYSKLKVLEEAKKRAGYGNEAGQFQPIYPQKPMPGPPGHRLVTVLTVGIPLGQLLLLFLLWKL